MDQRQRDGQGAGEGRGVADDVALAAGRLGTGSRHPRRAPPRSAPTPSGPGPATHWSFAQIPFARALPIWLPTVAVPLVLATMAAVYDWRRYQHPLVTAVRRDPAALLDLTLVSADPPDPEGLLQ